MMFQCDECDSEHEKECGLKLHVSKVHYDSVMDRFWAKKE